MKITKFTHSCLLVETDGPKRAVLFDPGNYSTVKPEFVNDLDAICITHEHPDHMDIPTIQQLQAKFPQAFVVAPSTAKAQLDQAGVTNVTITAPPYIRLFDAPHEMLKPLMMVDAPEEIGIHYLDMFTHPGDSHHFKETMPILALPVQAPWGSTVNAMALALSLRPKYVIPIHDWHWRDEAKQGMYERFAKRLAAEDIKFTMPIDGQPIEINL